MKTKQLYLLIHSLTQELIDEYNKLNFNYFSNEINGILKKSIEI